MSKPELGIKRQCRNCGNRFYDLSRDPIICPKCGTVFQAVEPKSVSPASGEVAIDDDAKPEAVAGPELVSLDEADRVPGDKVLETEEAEEAADAVGTDDETFLEEEEEGDDDVASLIDGDLEDDEEA